MRTENAAGAVAAPAGGIVQAERDDEFAAAETSLDAHSEVVASHRIKADQGVQKVPLPDMQRVALWLAEEEPSRGVWQGGGEFGQCWRLEVMEEQISDDNLRGRKAAF